MDKVKVRIAVAVDAKGNWNACGWKNARSDEEKMELCVEVLDDGEARYWLEAELPIPTVPTVQATVIEATP